MRAANARLAMHGVAHLGREFGERRPQCALRIARFGLGQQPPALGLLAIPPYRRPVGRLQDPFGVRPIARLSENERAQAQRSGVGIGIGTVTVGQRFSECREPGGRAKLAS
jgi:hypothetical protein